jgi:hypothetical protein
VYLLVTVAVISQSILQKLQCRKELSGSVPQYGKYGMLVGWVEEITGVKIEVSIGRFTVYLSSSSLQVSCQYVHEEKVIFPICFHNELNVLVDTAPMIEEAHLIWPMGPAKRPEGCPVKCLQVNKKKKKKVTFWYNNSNKSGWLS